MKEKLPTERSYIPPPLSPVLIPALPRHRGQNQASVLVDFYELNSRRV